MNCPSCGKRQPDIASSCSRCGAYLPPTSTDAADNDFAATPVEAAPLATNATSELLFAGFWRRAAALLIDFLVLLVLGTIAGGMATLVLGLPADAFGQLLGLVVAWLYYAGMESSQQQATLGKMALNIKVTDLQGSRIGFGRATGRHFAKILSSFIFMIGYIMAAFTRRKQGLHDMLAGCLVVRTL